MNPKTEPMSETQKALNEAVSALADLKDVRNSLRHVTGDTRIVVRLDYALDTMGRALSRLAAEVEGK